MLGIDHNRASIEERERFSFTKKRAAEAMLRIKETEGIYGCILLSTCNRMELWVSCRDELEADIFDILCSMIERECRQYRDSFTWHSGKDAIEHLFYLTCGLKSKITGEDQILSQVKDALELSRNSYCTDSILETLFRIAIAAAKEVKTQIPLSKVNSSVIHHVVHRMKAWNYEFAGKRCLVIGNGEMGKLAAIRLKEEGAGVTVTVRQYRSGVVEIPLGCERINYGDRFEGLEDYDLVISATASPNMTIMLEDIRSLTLGKPVLFLDLAVPRDIDPKIIQLSNVTLYDIDSFQAEVISETMKAQLLQIDELLRLRMEEFAVWYEGRDFIPMIQAVSESAAADVGLRINKTFKKIEIDNADRELLATTVHTAANKVVSKIIFGLRDQMKSETFRECMEALNKLY